MAIDAERADRLATKLIHTLKTLTSMRQHQPRHAEGVDHGAYPLLFTLADGPLRVSALAERVGSDISTVSRQVAQLVTAGMAHKRPDPDDGRAHVIELTDTADDLLVRIRARRSAYFQYLLRDWSQEDVETFTGLLARFEDSVLDVRAELTADPQLLTNLDFQETA